MQVSIDCFVQSVHCYNACHSIEWVQSVNCGTNNNYTVCIEYRMCGK